MNAKWRTGFGTFGIGWLLASALAAWAQYTNDNQNIDFGAGNSYSVSFPFYVGAGYSSDGLTIHDGGVLSSLGGGLGAPSYYSPGTNNSASVTDVGSLWTSIAVLSIGYKSGPNRLVVINGGAVYSGGGTVGDQTGANGNIAWVSDRGSIWSNYNAFLTVGNLGSLNSVVISNRGTIFSAGGTLGSDSSSSNNSVLVTGSGSVWTNDYYLDVGLNGGGNRLTVANTGLVVVADNVGVGVYGTGNKLLIRDGGTLINYHDGVIGAPASSNTALVTGSGSLWTNGGNLSVGLSGSFNSLVISNQGKVISSNGVVGGPFLNKNFNNVLVTDTNSTWLNTSNLYIGNSGSFNSLVISNGGTVFDAVGYVGISATASSNSVWVTSFLSRWSTFYGVSVGKSGPFNSLVISNGGYVSAGHGTVGDEFGASNNVAVVTGSNSYWSVLGDIEVGHASASNSLTISDGSEILDYFGFVGTLASASNNLELVTGKGSLWSSLGGLYVGNQGSFNSLVISNGGNVYAHDGTVGNEASASNNSALVTGPLSFWRNSGDLSVGFMAGSDSLVISNSGTVVASNVYVGRGQVGNPGNTITVTDGTLSVTQALNVFRGTLFLNSGLVDVGALFVTNPAAGELKLNGGTLSTGATLITNNGLAIVGDLVHTAIYQLKGFGVHTFADGLEIFDHAILTGCGTVNGKVVVEPGGRVIAAPHCAGLIFNGPVTNYGVMVAVNGGVIETHGPLVNNGLIVFNQAGTNFLGGFDNANGTLLDAGTNSIVAAGTAGQDFLLRVQSTVGFTYQLQYTDSLSPANWMPAGPPQPGTGGLLTLVHPGGAGVPNRFYQVVVGGF